MMKSPRQLSVLATTCLTVALGGTVAHGGDRSVAEFTPKESDQLDWRIVNDGVMGGLSKGKIEVSDKGILTFSGTLSLENNGGFSSFRSGEVEVDLGSFDGLVTRVKGDGRTYQVRLYTEERHRGDRVSFSADFETKKGAWAEVKVPFSDFKASWRGRSLDREFNPAEIRGLGMLLADKQPGPFKLQVDWLRAYEAGSSQGDTIVDLAVADGRFSTLASALKAAGLLEVLKGEGPFTVFAPTDKAFAKLPKETVASLLKPENKEKLQAILKYHVVSGSVGLSAALKAGEAGTLEGNPLTISFTDGRVKVGEASLLAADINASNGVIHVIDSVLLPPAPATDLIGVAKEAGSFGTLLAAVDAAGLTSTLQGEGPFTILAPTDEAFSKLPKDTVTKLLKKENLDQLKSILTYHAFAGNISAGDALNAGSAKTLNGQEVCFGIKNGVFQVNGATIRTTDIKADNGTIHVIDAVLLPASKSDCAPKGTCEPKGDCEKACPGDAPSPTARIEAAIDRGVPVFNKGDHAACAEIYENTLMAIASDERVDADMRRAVKRVLEKTSEHSDATAKAWIYRKAMDHVYLAMQPKQG